MSGGKEAVATQSAECSSLPSDASSDRLWKILSSPFLTPISANLHIPRQI